MQKRFSSLTGIDVEIIENPNKERKFHPETEIIYIIEGKVKLTVRDRLYELEKGGILLVNSMVPYKINGSGAFICEFHISCHILAHIVREEYFTFFCNTAADTARPYAKLQNILNRIIYNSLEGRHKTSCMTYSLEYQMLDCLIEDFCIAYTVDKQKGVKDSSERLQMMIHYVNRNYQSPISLKDLSEEMFLSVSALSRFFRKETGVYFAEFVTDVRMHYAVSDLLYTEESITKIAVDNGFSNPSVFSKLFQERYQMPPSNYRKVMQEKEMLIRKEQKEIQDKLKGQFEEMEEPIAAFKNVKVYNIESSVKDAKMYDPFWNKVINIGSAYNLTLANLQYHMLFLTEQLHFTHARIWNVFSNRMKIRRDHQDKKYNFDSLDTILDVMVNNGIRPYLDFGMRPECAVKTGREMVYFEEDHMEFYTMEEWVDLVQAFIRHIVKRYGVAETGKWIFEYSLDMAHQLYNTENGRFDFFEKYKYWYQIVREGLPESKIMGPSIVMDGHEKLFEEYLVQCRENDCIPDSITMLLFPYQSISDEDGSQYSQRISDLEFLTEQIEKVKQRMKKCGVTDVGLCVSEWNSSLSNRNYLNDSCFRAAYFMKLISVMWDKVDLTCFWMGSDWISNYYDSSKIIQGGVGLLTKDGIRKPAFYAISFLNQLGNQFIERGENYILTSNGKNSYYIACFNFKWYSCNYYVKGEDELNIKSLNTIFEDTDSIRLTFRLKDVEENKKYTIKKRLLNEEYGSILQEWIRFNCEEDLEGNDIKYLRDICIPHLNLEKRMSVHDILEFETELLPHETALIHIYQDE